ncbi:SGNH/GDSL hydrolase family protein [Salipaludibacillus sp. CF4.18]|uniref:SGNH/GDSL hydrolase family protein n=1 Tax=Salipaludibacillus sp. CF4.18 TaxID=3373081 RepID=UPI003EE602CD
MKNLFFIMFICLSIATILFGYVHYKDKLANIATAAKTESTVVVMSDLPEPEEQPTEVEEMESEVAFSLGYEEEETPAEIEGILGDWVEEKNKANDIRLSFLGSSSLVNDAEEKVSLPYLVSSKLESQLINQDITSTVIDVGVTLSIDVIDSDYVDTVIESNPDILFVEPFILNDINVIKIEDTLSNLKILLSTIEKELPDTSVILMPANPLADADYYTEKTTEDLASFAEKEGLDYANHWENWPAIDDPENLKKYLENSRPNTAGHQLWADYIVEYLTKQ